MAAISIQNDAHMARHRSPFELMQELTLVYPVQKPQQLRSSHTLTAETSLNRCLVDIQGGEGRWVDAKHGGTSLERFRTYIHLPGLCAVTGQEDEPSLLNKSQY